MRNEQKLTLCDEIARRADFKKNPYDYLFVIQFITSFGQYKNYWQTLFSTDFRKLQAIYQC